MANCKFKINIDGHYEEFNSEEELHSFLRENRKSLVTALLTDKIAFSRELNKQDTAVENLRKMSDTVTFVEDGHTLTINNGPLKGTSLNPVTKFINESKGESGNKLVPGFILSEWEARERASLSAEVNSDGTPKYDKPKVDELIQNVKNRWETQALVGTSWHKVAEAFFNGNVKTADDVFEIIPALQGDNYAAKSYLEQLQSLKDYLLNKHGSDAVFNTEVKLYDPETKVGGISDLVVVDKNGTSHIYDYKTSTTPEAEWAQSKFLTIDYQLGLYRQILRRANYDVGSVNYIPVKLNDLDMESRVIHSFNAGLPKNVMLTENSAVGRNINLLMPYDFSAKLKEITSNKEVIHFLKEAFNYDVVKSDSKSKVSVDEFINTKLQKTPNNRQYQFIDEMNNRQWRYIDSTRGEAFVKQAVQQYLTSLDEYTRVLPVRFYDFVTRAKESRNRNEQIDYLEWTRTRNVDTANKVERLLSKYIEDDEWTPLQSDALNDLGVLGFENASTNEVDFISITANHLESAPTLLRGKTLLGNFLEDNKAKTISGVRYDLKNKDIELLKVYAFIKNNESVFGTKKIGSIFAVNMYNNNVIPRVATQTVEAIERQWSALMQNIPSTLAIKANDWTPSTINFSDSLAAYIGQLLERADFKIARTKEIRKEYATLISATDREEKLESLGRIQDLLDQSIGYQIDKAVESKKDVALAKLLTARAILQLTNTPTQIEPQLKQYSFLIDENANFSNPNKVGHLTFRKMVEVVGRGINNTAHAFNDYKQNQAEHMNADLYRSKSNVLKTKVIGYNLDVFDNLFERDANGEKTMRFKDPKLDKSLTPEEAQYISRYVEIMAKTRVEKMSKEGTYTAEDLKNYMSLPEARNIPLMRASMLTAFVGKDYKSFFQEYARRALNPNNIYDESDESRRALENESKINNFFDIYDSDEAKREEKLASVNHSDFETDLEAVLDIYTLASMKQKYLGKEMPVINALKTFAALNEHYFFNENDNTVEALRNYVNTVALGNSLVAGESKALAVGSRIAQDVTSVGLLGFSVGAGMTETMTGMFNNITRTLANRYDEHYFGFSEFSKAGLLILGSETGKKRYSYENHSFVEALTVMFRLSELDLKQLAYKSQVGHKGITNFRSEHMYWMSTIPGTMNRVMLFVAQAIKDGTIDVDSTGRITQSSALQMKNGHLVYDERLDKRYKAYLDKPDMPDHLQTKAWKESRALYLGAKSDMSEEAQGLKSDGSLARPYTNKERDSMKEFSDEVHGNYDAVNKDNWSKTAFGRIIMQFKGGWLTAKKNRWYLATTPDSNKGKFTVKWVDGEPVRVWEGKLSEGIIQTLLAVGSEIKNRKTPLVWDSLDPSRKENLTLMFSDLALFGLFTALLSSLGWLTLSEKQDDPMQYQFARSLSNANQDLWIGNTIGAFTGNKNPVAMFSWGNGVVTNTWGLVTGETNAGTHLMSNVGMYRSINNLIGTTQ